MTAKSAGMGLDGGPRSIIAVLFLWLLFVLSIGWPIASDALEDPKTGLQDIGIESKLGQQVDLDRPFFDERGNQTTLREFVRGDVPLIITPVYYRCPRICGLLFEGVSRLLGELELEPGSQYRVVSVSFNPAENAEVAAKKAVQYRDKMERKGISPESWAFLTGPESSSFPLMKELGFKFAPDADEFAHSPVIVILTPDGEVSQYYTDIQFSPWDVRLSLVEASKGRIGSPVDHILLFCFRFDPTKGRYSWAAFNFLRFGTILCVLLCGLFVVRQVRRGRKGEAREGGA
jgi:protein SCO1/2